MAVERSLLEVGDAEYVLNARRGPGQTIAKVLPVLHEVQREGRLQARRRGPANTRRGWPLQGGSCQIFRGLVPARLKLSPAFLGGRKALVESAQLLLLLRRRGLDVRRRVAVLDRLAVLRHV